MLGSGVTKPRMCDREGSDLEGGEGGREGEDGGDKVEGEEEGVVAAQSEDEQLGRDAEEGCLVLLLEDLGPVRQVRHHREKGGKRRSGGDGDSVRARKDVDSDEGEVADAGKGKSGGVEDAFG